MVYFLGRCTCFCRYGILWCDTECGHLGAGLGYCQGVASRVSVIATVGKNTSNIVTLGPCLVQARFISACPYQSQVTRHLCTSSILSSKNELEGMENMRPYAHKRVLASKDEHPYRYNNLSLIDHRPASSNFKQCSHSNK